MLVSFQCNKILQLLSKLLTSYMSHGIKYLRLLDAPVQLTYLGYSTP